MDHSRAVFVCELQHELCKRCPDVVRAWLEAGLLRWREELPKWFTRVWWDQLPEEFRKGLMIEPVAIVVGPALGRTALTASTTDSKCKCKCKCKEKAPKGEQPLTGALQGRIRTDSKPDQSLS